MAVRGRRTVVKNKPPPKQELTSSSRRAEYLGRTAWEEVITSGSRKFINDIHHIQTCSQERPVRCSSDDDSMRTECHMAGFTGFAYMIIPRKIHSIYCNMCGFWKSLF